MVQKLRMTHQREIILDELRHSTHHPTADELYEQVKKKLPRISLATVYRNLEILSEAGIIRKLAISGRQKRFDWELSAHDHIFCVQCHRVDNITIEDKQRIARYPLDNRGYQINGCRLEFYGLCPECNPQPKGAKKMACKCNTNNNGLTTEQRKVLEALAQSKDACGSKDIAEASGIDAKQVSCQITALKKKGFIDSPVRCKYAITSDGKKALT